LLQNAAAGRTPPDLITDNARHNHLLAALPQDVWLRWQPLLELVDLPLGKVLCAPGAAVSHVYFPTTAVVSLLCLTRDGSSSEVAVIGNDGLVGYSLLMGGNATPSQAVVQSAGKGYRMSAHFLSGEVERGGPALAIMLRYTQALIAQVAQTAACNRHHGIDQQLSRRLLMAMDRGVPAAEVRMTQELASSLLGVRREGITAAALKLQQAGVISYKRGRIAVLDRARLEQRSCECYAVAKNEYDRLLPSQRQPAPLLATPLMPHPPSAYRRVAALCN
jgi:CRP-like cAMP-binding protein